MQMSAIRLVLRAGRPFLLLAALQAVPLVAIAALAPYDMMGTTRDAPATMGAFEVGGGQLPAPTGLVIKPI